MTRETIPERRVLEGHHELRAQARSLATVRRQQKTAFKKSVSARTPLEPQADGKGRPIWCRSQWAEEASRLWARAQTAEFRLRRAYGPQRAILMRLVLDEARGLEDIVGDMDSVGRAWGEIYILRAAALFAWDGVPTELEGLIARFRETEVFRELSRRHNEERTKRRLRAGYWKKTAVRAADKERKAVLRANMSGGKRAAESAARSERRRVSRARARVYSSMLEDEPIAARETEAA